MNAFDEAQLLIRLLREGRDYYAFAHEEVRDPDAAETFDLALRARRDLLEDLVATRLLFQTSPAHATRELPHDLGYEGLRRQFDALHPQTHAVALHERERRVVQLMESLLEAEMDSSPKLHAALRAHRAQFTQIEERLARWGAQPAV